MPLDPQTEALLAHLNQSGMLIDDSIHNDERWRPSSPAKSPWIPNLTVSDEPAPTQR